MAGDAPAGDARADDASAGLRPKLVGSTVRTGRLTPADRNRMYELLSAYYEGTDRDRFASDLAEKQYVVTMRDKSTRELQGFCTIHVGAVRRPDGRLATVLFTGDTVVARAYWGQKVLHTQISRLFLYLKVRYPARPLYWFLISKGYKTYKIIVRTCARTIPQVGSGEPAGLRELLDQVATARYGDRYDAARSVIEAGRASESGTDSDGGSGTEHVREGLAEVTPELRAGDPDVEFFVTHNPGYADGDELACLAHMRYADMLATIARSWRKRRKVRGGAD